MVSFRAFMPILLLCAFLLLFAGCKDEMKEAWQMGYQANYKAGYQEGLKAGKARGKEEGKKHGVAAASEDAKTGSTWQLYAPLAYGALVPGILLGIFVQYAILFACHLNERLPRPSTFAFVPAMKTSLCYSIFEQRFRLMVEFDEQLNKVLVTKNLKIAQIQAVHDAVRQRVMAASSIEELTETRLVEVANDEFAKIVAESEKINQIENNQRSDKPRLRNVCMCPHCGKRVQFPRKAANTTINCPYQNCGRPIRLPPLQSN